jgi:adenylyltransferase/sulfurtransferase
MNIIPGVTPCLHCLYPFSAGPGSVETCTTAGVLNMITGIIGSIESAEALKLLTGSPALRNGLMQIGIWDDYYDNIDIKRNPDCTVCGKRDFAWLNNFSGSYTTSLCGRDSVQVVPASAAVMDFERLAAKLEKAGSVQFNVYLLRFNKDDLEITLFKDGRAIIKNARNEDAAKSIYSEYIGL